MAWGDRFLLREDDLLLGDMQLQFEVVSEKRWPVPDLTLALVSGLLVLVSGLAEWSVPDLTLALVSGPASA